MGNKDFLSPTSLFWSNLILSVDYTNPRAEATPFSLAAGEGLRAAARAETGSADGHLCLSLSLVVLETCPELSETIQFSAQSKGSEKVMPLQCKFSL